MNYRIVSKEEKEYLRKEFIDRYIDTKTEYYTNYVNTIKEYPDGMCYDGYLWGSLNTYYKYIEKTMEQAIEYLQSKSTVFVMWDIYSNYRVFVNSVFSNTYPKDTVIQVNSFELSDLIKSDWCDNFANERYLPEDIYIFDNSINWYVIFTHEGENNFTNPEFEENDYVRISFVHELNN